MSTVLIYHPRYDQRDRAGGFCVFNDIVIVVRRLQAEGLSRIAVVDVDGHHGDGTQALLYDEPILTISLHQYDGRFYPRTGRALDPLVGLQLTTHTYQALIEWLHVAAHELCGGSLLLLGGGGYHPETVARCWSVMLGTRAGCVPQHRRAQYEALHDEPLAADSSGL